VLLTHTRLADSLQTIHSAGSMTATLLLLLSICGLSHLITEGLRTL
jgi:hypothetical protein